MILNDLQRARRRAKLVTRTPWGEFVNQKSSVPRERVQPGRWRFGQSLLDEQLAVLQVGTGTIEIDRSSYDVLLALLRHAGEVVTKEELLEAGWPGRFVSENSLAKAISRLRLLLGADAASIRAVHGYGYRLAAVVRFEPVQDSQSIAYPHDAGHLHEGDPLPHRKEWRLDRRLGQGGQGVIFLARSRFGESRAIKFASNEAGLRSLKREIALTRYIRAVKPELPDVAQAIDWNLTHAPFFLELPFFEDGDLSAWANARGGLLQVPQNDRLHMCAHLCEAVAGLHEIGIIHKDLKPENLYPHANDDGQWRIVLADLGASDAAPSPRLAALGITMSLLASDLPSRAGSLLYMAPEVIAGDVPSQRSDVFALGVLIYQIMVGDLRRPLAPGWEAEIDDALLREDIALAAASNPERRLLDARALAERLRTLGTRHEQVERQLRRDAAHLEQSRQLVQSTRRRKLLAGASMALGLVLALSLWQQHNTARARAAAEQAALRAEAEAARSQGLVSFLVDDVLKQADPFAGGDGPVTLRQAVDRAARRVNVRFGKDPRVAAEIQGTLGAAYEGMNEYAAAVEQYRGQVRRLRSSDAPPAGIARAQASLCTASLWQGDITKALSACEQADRDYRIAGLVPDRPQVFLALADSRQSRNAAAVRRLEPRMDRIRQSGDDDLHGSALWFAGVAYSRLGRLVDAERIYRELVTVRRRQAKAPATMQLAWALTDQGKARLMLGQDAAGRADLAQAAAMFAQVGGDEHPHGQTPRVHLATHELALGHWKAAYALAEPTYRTLHQRTSWQNWTIYAALAAMTAAAEAGDRPNARRIMGEFEEVVRHGLDRDFPYLREVHWTNYAATHLALGDPARAQTYIARLQGLVREPEASPLLVARTECLTARYQHMIDKPVSARQYANACRARVIAAASARSPLTLEPDRILASLNVAEAR